MSDLIDRQLVIDGLSDLVSRLKFVQGDLGGAVSGVREYIKTLPSVEPEQKKGRWQRRKGSDCWECSQCHAVLENEDLGMHNFYFCYHCGANMMTKSGYMDIEEVHYG